MNILPWAGRILLKAQKVMLGISWVYPLSRWCIALLYIYDFSSVIDFSSEKYIVSTGHRYSWCQQRRNDKYIMMQYTIRINSIPWSGDCCQFKFDRIITERWLSNFLLQKQPRLYAWCLWAYCDKNLLSIYPECNIPLLGVKWFKFLSRMHSTLPCSCVAFATENRTSCPFLLARLPRLARLASWISSTLFFFFFLLARFPR